MAHSRSPPLLANSGTGPNDLPRAQQDEAAVNDKPSQNAIAADPNEIPAPQQLDPTEILASVGAALYRWDIKNDVLTWSPNAGDVLLVRDPGSIGSGRAYAQLLEPDNAQAPT